tara:strand:- start:69 stop:467 length:399 start_codon:yes stop_codon:yes gene_type:complete
MHKKFIVLALLMQMMVSSLLVPVEAASLLSRSLGPLVGLPFGVTLGLLRGASSKSLLYIDSFDDDLGNNLLSKVLAVPSGLVLGTVAGGASGTLKGAHEGVHYGYSEPFSKKSLALEGEFLDYDAYSVLEGH